MPDFEFSTHAKDMLRERRIAEEWVWRVIETPSRKKKGKDGICTIQNRLEKGAGVFCVLSSILTLILSVL